ncbi:carboxy terminal-processing peptidase [Silanimonas lenta]|uniref:carboxy terminal-processing peptidase n=1 Tax=Silanimonas lenta TaxID=265429 RepID=UPI002FE418B9
MPKPLPLLLAALLPLALAGTSAVPAAAPAAAPAAPRSAAAPAAAFAPTADQIGAARMVHGVLSDSRYVYAPRPLDAKLGAVVFRRYLESLDRQKLFFLQEDIDRFKAVAPRFDEAVRGNAMQPAFDIYALYMQRVAERVAFARERLKGEFDFDTDEVWHYKREDAPWARSSIELDALWAKYVKNDWLRLKLAGRSPEEIRRTLDRRYAQLGTRVAKLKPEDAFETFLNAYTTSLDPHTSYMGPRSAENFNMSMRLSLEGIGAVLQTQDDYVVVRTLVPGGPAAKSGRISVGDRIVAVGQGDGPMVDVMGWRIDDVVQLVRGPKGTRVRLDIIPAAHGLDGEHVLVELVRERVKLEEQAARRQLIEADGRRIGVIRLPTFYADFEAKRRGDPDARSATTDVARLLAELKAEKVDGVVVDLRGNGGGSLTEAVELTGLFIDTGPVVQVREAGGRVSVEADDRPGVAWDGPLAVLVDRSSASASEIFAAAIQDYGRGLVLGETTFGKGTVQNLIDLDRFQNSRQPRFGQLKLTVAQFFRISGGTTQFNGVVPDIAFPVTLDADEFGESTYENALPATRIAPAEHRSYGNFAPLLLPLAQRHEARIAKDVEIQWWKEDVAQFRAERERGTISLNEAERRAERERAEARRLHREAERKRLGLNGLPPSRADDGLQADERDVAQQVEEEKAAENLIDPLLRESAFVLSDAIHLLSRDARLTALVLPQGGKPTRWAD